MDKESIIKEIYAKIDKNVELFYAKKITYEELYDEQHKLIEVLDSLNFYYLNSY